jgi:phosphoribosylaminoimidazole carboxylase (NCAIR synthetase)
MAYSREEQETCLVFDNSTGQWSIYSTVPKHIRKLANLCDLVTLESENGRAIAVKGKLTEKQVSMKKERIMSEEQKEKAAERLSKARNSL